MDLKPSERLDLLVSVIGLCDGLEAGDAGTKSTEHSS